MRRLATIAAVALAAGACATARTPAAAEGDRGGLLAESRIARLPKGEREAWRRYLETSRRLHRLDVDSMARELKRLGRDRMTKAPDVRHSISIEDAVRAAARLPDDSLRTLVATALSFQTPSGGWSKHVDYAQGPRRTGEAYFSETDRWSYTPTLDNDATVAQLRLLHGAWDRTRDETYRAAFLRGIDYLLAAQMPNGCWPQVFPLQGGYHDAATFNDDAIVNVLALLRDVIGTGTHGSPFVPAPVLARVTAAEARGVGCILDSQVTVRGVRTVWGQQHDPLTLLPTSARSYELAGLSGRESASIMRFLMDVPQPSDAVVAAVHAAADWFKAHQLTGYDYDYLEGRTENPSAAPIWARLTEVETDRPIFANRDGVKLYDWTQLTDRRSGYAWYGREPATALREYEKWARKHPRK